MINRRGFIAGLSSLLAAPVIVPRASLMLMPRRPLITVSMTINYDNALAWMEDQIREALTEMLRDPRPIYYTDAFRGAAIDAINKRLFVKMPGDVLVRTLIFTPPGRILRMPLTSKGEEIKANMEQQYGSKKGESVFYASKNAGTIKGVDEGEMMPGGDPAEMGADPGSAEMGDADPRGGERIEDPAGHTAGYAFRGQNPVKAGDARDYDPLETIGEFKVAGPPGLTLAQVQADADALWKRQYNDGPLGSDNPKPIP